jgi:23S rRNA pseudouridine1911/1915/1917 synthase
MDEITVDQNIYEVTLDEAGIRLDRFIADKDDSLSRSFIQKLISDGYVTIGESSVKSSYKVRPGDSVEVKLPKPKAENIPQAENIPLDIIFEDYDIIVVNKPAGMIVHPAAGANSGTLVNAILGHVLPEFDSECFVETPQKQNEMMELISIAPTRPGIVHRIDKDTSGILVVTKSVKAYHNLIRQFKEHSINRKYITLICSGPKQDSGIIVATIGRSRHDRKKMAVDNEGKEAITRFSIIERYSVFSLAEVTLETGRTHQIRVHLSHIGYPVVGDPTYGGRKRAIKSNISDVIRSAIQNLSRQALHAYMLGFIHPATGEYMEFSAPIPEDMQNVIDALRLSE